MKTPSSIGRTIVACLVLHNLTIDANDDVDIHDIIDEHLSCHNKSSFQSNGSNRSVALSKRDNIKDYLMQLHGQHGYESV